MADISSYRWRLDSEVQVCTGLALLSLSWRVDTAPLPASSHGCPLRFCVLISSSYEGTSHTGSGPPY